MSAPRTLNCLTGPLLTTLLATFVAIPVHAAPAPSVPDSLAAIERDLAALFQQEAENLLSQHLQSEGRLAHVSVRIVIDSASSKLTADFGPGFRPYPDEVAAEDFLHQLAATLRYAADQAGIDINDVFYLFQGRPLKHYYPEELAVPCSMKELIHAEPGYEDFPARTAPSVGRHGENRIGTMPSVLVEVAYHSNAEDAAALQNPLFRSASMKGVEKGYRLFRDGKSCAPFTLAKPQDVSIPAGTNQRIEMEYQGNPQFPVVMEFILASCSKPGACTPSRTTFTDPESPLFATMRCLGSATGEARWQVVLRDADGVATKPVEFLQTCRKP